MKNFVKKSVEIIFFQKRYPCKHYSENWSLLIPSQIIALKQLGTSNDLLLRNKTTKRIQIIKKDAACFKLFEKWSSIIFSLKVVFIGLSDVPEEMKEIIRNDAIIPKN